MLTIDHGPGAMCAYVGVDLESEIEHSGSGTKTEQVAFRSEGKHLLSVDVHAHILHQLHRPGFGSLKDVADVVHPLVGAVALNALVAPMCGKTFLSHKIHTAGAELHLYPFRAGSHHRGMKALITVAFGKRDPVFHTGWVGGVHIRHNGISEPAVAFLLLAWSVDNHSDCEKVVDAAKVHFLFLHLAPDGGDGFCASLDVELKAGSLELSLHRVDKRFYIGVAATFCLVELACNLGVYLAVGIFQR